MDADWIPFYPTPSRPQFVLPTGAVDAHCHVFGPASKFPFAPQRKYTPCDAGKDKLFELRDFLGFQRNVVVQATCHGHDNSALLDVLTASDNMARGVASVGADITDKALGDMHSAGIRGVRFNFVRRLVDATPRDVYMRIAERVHDLGWHIVVYFEAADLEDLAPFLGNLPNTVVVDHMGRPNIAAGIASPGFERFVNLLADHENIWSKVTCPERLSMTGPPYSDVVPFARKITEKFPNRVLWGTDWPHPNMKSHMPDDGKSVDFIPTICPNPLGQQRLLVDNPMRLYWP